MEFLKTLALIAIIGAVILLTGLIKIILEIKKEGLEFSLLDGILLIGGGVLMGLPTGFILGDILFH